MLKFKLVNLLGLTSAFRNQRGATMIEYALLAALIAVAAIAAMMLLGDGLSAIFTDIATQLASA